MYTLECAGERFGGVVRGEGAGSLGSGDLGFSLVRFSFCRSNTRNGSSWKDVKAWKRDHRNGCTDKIYENR